MLIIGVKESSLLNMIFTGVNMVIILFIVIAGFTKANIGYWSLDTTVNSLRFSSFEFFLSLNQNLTNILEHNKLVGKWRKQNM